MHKSIQLFATVAALGAAFSTSAQQAGDVMLRAGYGTIAPNVTSGDMSAPSISGSKSDISSGSSLLGGVTYMVTDNMSVDLPLALPFKHKISGAGALAGTGDLGEVQALPITLFGQYRLLDASDALRPYAGLGLTYAYFFNESGSGALTAITNPGGTPTKITVAGQWTYTIQFGASYAFDKQWFVDGFYSYTPLKTTTTLSTGQTQEITLNPSAFGLSLGYKF